MKRKNPLQKEAFEQKAYAVSVQKKLLAVSATLGEYIERKVDIYECSNVFALVNNPSGEYKAIPISATSNRLRINSRPLIRYIQEKYHQKCPLKLNAWYDGANVLFCLGDAGENKKFHHGFIKLSDPPRFRYDNSVRIIGNRFIVSSMLSKSLEQRLTFMEYGNGFAFVNDKDGLLCTSNRSEFGTKAIKSISLVKYVLQKFETDFMFGIIIEGGIAFSKERHIQSSDIRLIDAGILS